VSFRSVSVTFKALRLSQVRLVSSYPKLLEGPTDSEVLLM